MLASCSYLSLSICFPFSFCTIAVSYTRLTLTLPLSRCYYLWLLLWHFALPFPLQRGVAAKSLHTFVRRCIIFALETDSAVAAKS